MAAARFYTPGPWRSNGLLIEAPQMALGIATFHSPKIGSAPYSMEEAKANADLAAAAPELRDSLAETLRMLEAAHRQLGMYSADNPRVAKARAALAKAGAV